MRLKNKTILITGATSGIGLATAQCCIHEGAFVIFTGRNQQNVEKTQQQLGQHSLGFICDAASVQQQKQLIQQLQNSQYQLDALFLNAGNVQHLKFEDWTEEAFNQVIDTNLKGAFFLVQAALPILNSPCSIVFCGSTSIHIALEQSSVYAASKIALRSLVKTLSRELLSRKVRCNLLSPGPTLTPALDKVAPTEIQKIELKKQIEALVPLQHLADPMDIANAFIYLASDESKFVIGTELLVDGGVANL